MIDLLPPPVKEHKRYGQLNRRMLRYGILTLATAVLITAVFVGSWLALKKNEADTELKLTDAVAKNAQYASIEADAKSLADRLKSIEEVQTQQSHYTRLLKEVSAVTPPGVYIFTLQVSSEANASMRIAAFAETEQAAAAFQQSIERSGRFASAALQGLDDDKDPYTGKPSKRLNLTVGLKAGALK